MDADRLAAIKTILQKRTTLPRAEALALVEEVERLQRALNATLSLVSCTCQRSDVHAADCALTLALRQAGRL